MTWGDCILSKSLSYTMTQSLSRSFTASNHDIFNITLRRHSSKSGSVLSSSWGIHSDRSDPISLSVRSDLLFESCKSNPNWMDKSKNVIYKWIIEITIKIIVHYIFFTINASTFFHHSFSQLNKYLFFSSFHKAEKDSRFLWDIVFCCRRGSFSTCKYFSLADTLRHLKR